VIRPARADSSTQAAVIGSTPASSALPAKWRAEAAASAPTPIGTIATSTAAGACSSTSWKIVA
jgi:hypothetical protein